MIETKAIISVELRCFGCIRISVAPAGSELTIIGSECRICWVLIDFSGSRMMTRSKSPPHWYCPGPHARFNSLAFS